MSERALRRCAVLAAFSLLTVACSKRDTPAGSDVAPAGGSKASASAPQVSSAAPSAGSAAELPAKRAPLNVMLITIDSLRADMPWAGYERPIAPNLTRLAEQSVVYNRSYSSSSYTAKSVATLLTGRYPSTLYRDGFFFAKYSAANVFLAELLAERGIRSIGWHAHLYFGRGKGLEQGFSTWELVPGISFDPQTDNHVTSEKMTKLGIELLGAPANVGKQFFAWAHYMDPHDQYNKHKEAPDFGNKGRDKYDSEVWHVDHWLEELLKWSRQQSWWSNTALIISADHGEAFGEHQMYRHAFELWEVLTRVPLIIHGPGMTARRIEQRRSAIDLAPTILDLMQVPIPAEMQGRSLAPELYGGEAPSHEPILLELTEDSHNPPRRALIFGDYKIIEFGGAPYQLYDITNDPGELKDLAKERPDELARMKKLLAERYATLPTIAPYGGMKLKNGGTARGPVGPAK